MNIGVLTGGGDCPGLNAVIRAVVKKGHQLGYDIIGIKDGWLGLVDNITVPLTVSSVSGILPRGGTILGTSRTNPYKKDGDESKVLANVEKLGLDAIICIGGDDTLGVAAKLYGKGIKTIGVPKTIDNDLSGTDVTFGFDTAVNIVTEALDRLHSTTESHHRVMIVEVMGRHAGWIAVHGGIAGGADIILIPERPFMIDDIVDVVTKRREEGKTFSIVVIAEGAYPKEAGGHVTKDKVLDAFGNVKLGGVGELVAGEVEKRTGVETRYVVLGHLQRGGTPTAYDRVLATRYGVRAVELVEQGKFGRMVALKGSKIVDVSLEEAIHKTRTVDDELYGIAEVFFG